MAHYVHINHESIRGLLEYEALNSIINGETPAIFVQWGCQYVTASLTIFDTVRGDIKSNGTAVTHFYFPQLKTETIITHQFVVIIYSSDNMYIGRDIINALGPNLIFNLSCM